MCYINSLYLAILLLKLQWHTGVYEEMFHVNSKIAETMQNIEILWLESQVYKKRHTLIFIREISDFDLEIRRYGPKSGVPWIIRES